MSRIRALFFAAFVLAALTPAAAPAAPAAQTSTDARVPGRRHAFATVQVL